MSEIKSYIQKLFSGNNIKVSGNRDKMFEEFVTNQDNINVVNKIKEFQDNLMSNWKLITRIKDIQEQSLSIPNATVGKKYEAKIDFLTLGWNDVIFSEFDTLERYGLLYDNESETIQGVPSQSGDFKIKLKFRVEGEAENSVPNEKYISLIINADPKSLWKNIPSNQEDIYWKEDNAQVFQALGDKHIVVSSKRGRSHGNVGSFRDDDFAFKHFEKTGWSVVTVSDGAGSAKSSRKGSELACKTVVEYFENTFTEELTKDFDELITNFHQDSLPKNDVIEAEKIDNDASKNLEQPVENSEIIVEQAESNGSKISKFIYHNLGNAAQTVHKVLEDFANKNEMGIKDLHSTLIFSLFKKYDFGYVIMSFGVGDCPVGLLYNDSTELKLMNWLDVGEFGGGTRFITMPEIFASDKFSSRFGFKLVKDFSYLMLMTDGIYDAKFVVEANLEKIEKWQEFLSDLDGNNDDNIKVEFDKNNQEIANQLSTWMDFWSPGNHDDRTLAIVF